MRQLAGPARSPPSGASVSSEELGGAGLLASPWCPELFCHLETKLERPRAPGIRKIRSATLPLLHGDNRPAPRPDDAQSACTWLPAFADEAKLRLNAIVEAQSNTINKYELITETGPSQARSRRAVLLPGLSPSPTLHFPHLGRRTGAARHRDVSVTEALVPRQPGWRLGSNRHHDFGDGGEV